MPAHNQRKRAYAGRPKYIGIGRGFGATLQDALMHRPQFVHVVALVGAGTGVHKRKHPRYEQRGLMVSHRKGTRKYGARLAVLAMTVAEKQRVGSRIAMPQMARLPHETTVEHRALVYTRPRRDYEIIHDDPIAHMHRRSGIAVDTAVAQPRCSAHRRKVANAHIADITGVDYAHIPPHRPCGRCMFFRIEAHQLPHLLGHFRPVPVQSHDVGLMRRQFVAYHDFAPSGLIHDRDFHPVAESSDSVGKHAVYVYYDSIVAYRIVGYIVVHILDDAIIAHRDIVQHRVPYAGMLPHAAGQQDFTSERPQLHMPAERHIANISDRKSVRHKNITPVTATTVLFFQYQDFVIR